jgi:metal transporter CNNM
MKSKPPIVGSRSNQRNRHGSTRIITLVFGVLAQVARTVAAPLKELSRPHTHEDPDPEDANLWLYLGVAAVLVLLGGAFAGLTIA